MKLTYQIDGQDKVSKEITDLDAALVEQQQLATSGQVFVMPPQIEDPNAPIFVPDAPKVASAKKAKSYTIDA